LPALNLLQITALEKALFEANDKVQFSKKKSRSLSLRRQALEAPLIASLLTGTNTRSRSAHLRDDALKWLRSIASPA
jgi:hypothetical protein